MYRFSETVLFSISPEIKIFNMPPIKILKARIAEELNQQESFQLNLIAVILRSKRLLADHLEILEESLEDLDRLRHGKRQFFTFPIVSGILASSFFAFMRCKSNLKYIIPGIAGIAPLLYCIKLVQKREHDKLESNLGGFLKLLDQYETTFRKNLQFLQESQHLKATSALLKKYDKDSKFSQDLIHSMKRVILMFYDVVKELEHDYIIYEKYDLVYEPFEDINSCDLMILDVSACDHKNIKDFFNIFAYVQSQLILRLGLIVASNLNEGVGVLSNQLVVLAGKLSEEKNCCSKFLEMIAGPQKNLKLYAVEQGVDNLEQKEMVKIKKMAQSFSAKILAVSLNCQYLDEELEDKKNSENILSAMAVIDGELAVCKDEYKRLVISYQKLLNIEVRAGKVDQETLDSALLPTSVVRVIPTSDEPLQDDFFVLDGFEEDLEVERLTRADEIEEINSRIAKRYFKPVLRQLREKLEPIGEKMKERERKVLQAKGIEFQEDEPDYPATPGTPETSEDEGSDDEIQKKKIKSRRKYDEFREFLEKKEPINIFAGGLQPITNFMNEEVLE